ncbi:hypothetical protein [Teredinibacter franksiae]|uniref:hypothetical protein n=1 Tax=Teredinibacter franksiae TaxID=2761453 RepID=UPI001FE699F2|nr:hypothetical protein [Teredinibacter franksiae]
MKRRIDELEELAATVDTLTESPSIAEHINDEAIEMIGAMMRLEPNSQTLSVTLQNAEQLADTYRNHSRPREIYRLQRSDAGIARTLYMLNDTGRILRKRQAAGKLDIAQMESLILELSWTHIMVGVVSNVAQGHQSLNRGDVLKAYAFYKKAQQVAMQSSNSDDKRQELIKELSDMLSNKRKALSPSLMPEAEFNPTKDTESLPQNLPINQQFGA